MTQSQIANRIKLITAIATVLLLILVCIVIYQYAKLGNLASKNASLDRQIAENSITEADLRAGIDRRNSDSYVESQAREGLGMIGEDGETIYIIK